MSDPIIVNKDTLTKKGGALKKRDAALRLHELAHACGVALSFYTCQTLIFDICVAEQSFLALQDAGHAELHQRLSRTGVISALPGGGAAQLDLFQQGLPQLPDGPVSNQPVSMPSTGVGAGVVSMPPTDGNAGGGGVARAAAPRSTAEQREKNRLRKEAKRRSEGAKLRQPAMTHEERLAANALRMRLKRLADKAASADGAGANNTGAGDDSDGDPESGAAGAAVASCGSVTQSVHSPKPHFC